MIWLCFIAASLLTIQLAYYIFIFSKFKIPTYKIGVKNNTVSIIVCSKNEEQNLKMIVPLLLNQLNIEKEIILVDDGSTDQSKSIIQEFESKYQGIIKGVYLTQDENRKLKGKKFALLKGIEAASHNWLLFTDADCRPLSNAWAFSMVGDTNQNTEIILGFSPVNKKKSFFNYIVCYDNFFTAFQYFSYSIAGITYMGVGRNLAIKKSSLQNFSNYKNTGHISSGDDDLLVQEISTKSNTEIRLQSQSFVKTEGKDNFFSFLFQKTRHSSAGRVYQPKILFLLQLFMTSRFLLYACFIIFLITGKYFCFLILFIIFTLTQLFYIYKPLKITGYNHLFLPTLLLDFIYVCIIAIIPLHLATGKKEKWK